jgi:RHS repeat-associated protein
VGIEQTFDAAGRRTEAAFAFGVTDDMVNTYTYGNLGRMTRIEQSGQQGGNAVAQKRIDLAYDAASRWGTLTRYADLAGTDLVAESSWTYDNASRLTGLTHAKGANTLAGYSWTYDSSGRVTQFDSVTDGTVDYTYDDTNQLTGADYDYQTDESYSYDANGNRTMTGYATGDDNRLTSDGTYRYEYDAEGNRTARYVDEDSSDTLNSGDTDITEYTWDYRNRLTNVTERATYGGSATKVTSFGYDHENRLVSESADPDGAGEETAEETYYAYDGNQIALQFNGTESADLSHRYLWGTAVDQVLADEQVTSLNYAGDILWPLTDNLGTVRDLATYDSQNDTTTVANHITYDAYGKLTSETNSAVAHLFGFTGRPFDEATGLQNNLNRWYDPATGRWLSQDPSGFDARDMDLYRYVGNCPVRSTDPSGLAPPTAPGAQPPSSPASSAPATAAHQPVECFAGIDDAEWNGEITVYGDNWDAPKTLSFTTGFLPQSYFEPYEIDIDALWKKLWLKMPGVLVRFDIKMTVITNYQVTVHELQGNWVDKGYVWAETTAGPRQFTNHQQKWFIGGQVKSEADIADVKGKMRTAIGTLVSYDQRMNNSKIVEFLRNKGWGKVIVGVRAVTKKK